MRQLRDVFKGDSKFWWMMLAFLVLLYGVFSQSYSGRIDIWESNVAYCESITIPAAVDAAARESDLGSLAMSTASFASSASKARARDGNPKTAKDYEGNAMTATEIERRSNIRKKDSLARAAVPCITRFPRPTNPIHFPWD